MPDTYVVLGAGVTGLTTAHELTTRFPTAEIIIIAKHIPGDLSIEYASPCTSCRLKDSKIRELVLKLFLFSMKFEPV